jgi:hypothetical protein
MGIHGIPHTMWGKGCILSLLMFKKILMSFFYSCVKREQLPQPGRLGTAHPDADLSVGQDGSRHKFVSQETGTNSG